jgi:hypothetical protein
VKRGRALGVVRVDLDAALGEQVEHLHRRRERVAVGGAAGLHQHVERRALLAVAGVDLRAGAEQRAHHGGGKRARA